MWGRKEKTLSMFVIYSAGLFARCLIFLPVSSVVTDAADWLDWIKHMHGWMNTQWDGGGGGGNFINSSAELQDTCSF